MHNGPVRFIFKGDPSIGKKYTRVARKYIGIWNTFSNAPRWKRILPDGAEIQLIRLSNNNYTAIIDVKGIEYGYQYRGLVCTPASNDAPNGWGNPFNIDPPLGTVGGDYPHTILRDPGDPEYSPRRYPDYGWEFPTGVVYGEHDWRGNDDEALTYDGGPQTRTLTHWGYGTVRPQNYSIDTVYRDGKILCDDLDYGDVACAIRYIHPHKYLVIINAVRSPSTGVEEILVRRAKIPENGDQIVSADFEQIGETIALSTIYENSGNIVSTWLFNESGTEAVSIRSMSATGDWRTQVLSVGKTSISLFTGPNECEGSDFTDIRHPIAADYINGIITKVYYSASSNVGNLEFSQGTLTWDADYQYGVYPVYLDVRNSLFIYYHIPDAYSGEIHFKIWKDGKVIGNTPMIGFSGYVSAAQYSRALYLHHSSTITPYYPRFSIACTSDGSFLFSGEPEPDSSYPSYSADSQWWNLSDFIEPVSHMSVIGNDPRFLNIGII